MSLVVLPNAAKRIEMGREAFLIFMHGPVRAAEGAMASVAEQQQLKKEQLLASLGQLLAGQSPDIQAAAILAVGNLNVLTCATLMEREVDVRRAAVMQLVQQATGG